MFKRFVSFFAFAALAFAAHAVGSTSGATVSNFTTVNAGAQTLVQFTGGTTTGQPGCASSNPARYAIDTSTANGRHLVTLLQQAAITGKTVGVQGTGACTVYSGFESLDYVGFNL